MSTNILNKIPLMRRAIALWLIDETKLTFQQIANFCGMHIAEVEAIADGDVATGISKINPIDYGQLDADELARCEADESTELQLKEEVVSLKTRSKKPAKYTPIARRMDKPDAIFYLIKYFPTISDGQIKKLVGTTRITIDSVRNRTHWNYPNLHPKDPVLLGFCNQGTFNEVVEQIKKDANLLSTATK